MNEVRERKLEQGRIGIRKILLARRMEKGMSMADVHAQCGVHPPNLSRIENGLSNPGVHLLQRLSDLYGLTLGELFGGSVGGSVAWIQIVITMLVSASKRSYRDLGAEMSIDSSYLHMVAAGVRSPSMDTVLKVAMVFNVPPSSLFFSPHSFGKANGKKEKNSRNDKQRAT